MKITNLYERNKIYTSNVYLITGDYNSLEDVNTLIDVGRDPSVISRLEGISTGVGKPKVEQVILTHSHYDHASLLPLIKDKYNPRILAYSPNIKEVDTLLQGGEILRIGDKSFEVIHAPGHSGDSICLYCPEEKVLFAGDTPLVIRTRDTNYDEAFIKVMAYIAAKPIDTIYFGHGEELREGCNKMIISSLEHLRE